MPDATAPPPSTVVRPTRRRAVALMCAAAIGPAARAATPGEVMVGAVLRDATMQGLNGPAKRLSDFRGRPLIINVWASWCGPCRAEMGSLERLAWQEQSVPFVVIGISTDDHEAAAKSYLRAANATLNHYIDQGLELENMLGADRLPLTVLLDAQGKVLGKHYGAWEWDKSEAREWIESRLRGRK